MHYLDHAAATPMRPCALERLSKASAEDFANPSSGHRLGKVLGERISAIEALIVEQLKLPATSELIFTSCATESNNLFFNTAVKSGDKIYIDESDHPSILEPLRKIGAQILPIPLSDGDIDWQRWPENLDQEARGISISALHGLTGRELDIAKLRQLLKTFTGETPFVHLDLSQAASRMPTSDWSVADALTLSAHKMGGPKGIAAIITKRPLSAPAMVGGGQQKGLRPGTLPYPLIECWAAVWEELPRSLPREREQAAVLSDALANGLTQLGMERLGGSLSSFGPWIHLYQFKKFGAFPSDMVMRLLEQKEIYVSSSTACNHKKKGAVSEFAALGLPESEHGQVLRISFGHCSEQKDIEALVRECAQVQKQLATTLGMKRGSR